MKSLLILGALILIALLLPGCVAQRANDHMVDKDGVTHDRAWVELSFYGFGDRKVTGVDISDTKTTSRVKIGEQGQQSSARDIIDLLNAVKGAATQP